MKEEQEKKREEEKNGFPLSLNYVSQDPLAGKPFIVCT